MSARVLLVPVVGVLRGAGWVGQGSTHPAGCCEEVPRSTQRSGPDRREWWGAGTGDYRGFGDGGGDGPGYHLLRRPGRSGQPALPVPRTLRIAASQPIRARFQLIFYKVSQNDEVSPEMCQKACHSPCSIFRVGKSPLEILRFPFSAAFSPKELMGHF